MPGLRRKIPPIRQANGLEQITLECFDLSENFCRSPGLNWVIPTRETGFHSKSSRFARDYEADLLTAEKKKNHDFSFLGAFARE